MTQTDQDQALRELQNILLSEQEEALRLLRNRIADLESRTTDVAEVLPQALNRAAPSGLSSALTGPIAASLRRVARRERKMLAEVMFPVMMPAIRRAVLETLRAWVKTVNQVIDHSFSIRGMSWRWQALRTGVPFSEIVLKHTLIYRVEQVFLIHRESGLLLAHQFHPDVVTRDSNAVSAMLTAIQDFMHDSFDASGETELASVDVGALTLWVEHDEFAYLACAIRGVPPESLRSAMRDLLDNVLNAFGSQIRSFSGDTKDLDGVELLMEEALDSMGAESQPGSLTPYLLAVLAMVLLGWVGLRTYRMFTDRSSHVAHVTQVLRKEPGYLVQSVEISDGSMMVRGLKDPLARPLNEVLGHDDVSGDFKPFMSLDSAMVTERLRQWLEVPDTVDMELTPKLITFRGAAPAEWLASLHQSRASDRLGYSLNADQVYLQDEWLASLRALELPERVQLLDEGHLSGQISWQEWLDLKPHLAELNPPPETFHALMVDEWQQIEDLRQQIDGVFMSFESDTRPSEDVEVKANAIQKVMHLAQTLNLSVTVEVSPFTDGLGSERFNLGLQQRRAQLAIEKLTSHGIPNTVFEIVPTQITSINERNEDLRRVDLTVKVDELALDLEQP